MSDDKNGLYTRNFQHGFVGFFGYLIFMDIVMGFSRSDSILRGEVLVVRTRRSIVGI